MKQPPIKVFVASSNAMKGLADALCLELEQSARDFRLEVKAQVWHREVAPPGPDILTALIDQCRGSNSIGRSDYFIAILTRDDNTEKKGRWTETPRDNCIFELGLFIGGLNFEFRRCFMLCSIAEEALPSDLAGHTYLPFTVPEPPSPAAYREAIKTQAATIVTQILDMKRFKPAGEEAISRNDLMEFERLEPDGDLEEGAEVLVNRSQPVEERSSEFAAAVNLNMRKGINYRYIFHDIDSMPLIARLIYKIATLTPETIAKREALSEGKIRENLKLIAEQMSIHFLPSSRAIEFCVHNAESVNAVCYLRKPDEDQYIEWCRNQAALNIARELKAGSEAQVSYTCVFCSTNVFDVHTSVNKSRKDLFWREITRLFNSPALEQDIRLACFGE